MESRSRDSSHRHGVRPNAKKEMSPTVRECERRRTSNDNLTRGPSSERAERMQTAANRRKGGRRENGSTRPDPWPTVADSCAHNEMVRRGSIAHGAAGDTTDEMPG